jgi:hypothetical protein
MDFDFLDKTLIEASRDAILRFKTALEGSAPSDEELKKFGSKILPYPHAKSLPSDFRISAVDGSGEYPVLQQDDIFVHFATASGVSYETCTHKQNKIAAVPGVPLLLKKFILLRDQQLALREGYRDFVENGLGILLKDLVEKSDYCSVFSAFGKGLSPKQVTWSNIRFPQASQITSHAYQLRSMAELGMAIKMLEQNPRYLLIDTSLVYFLLGEAIFLPEIFKRYLVNQATAQGTAVVALCKSHNIPNGDLIGRFAKEEHGLKDHWYLRLPSSALGEPTPTFLKDKEIPPKLGVSYLFKFEATSFPMRIDLDVAWWRDNLADDPARESRFFSDLDFTCHEVRSYGYPYPMHAAHRRASLTAQERKAVRDLLNQQAQREGLARGSVVQDPESVHMGGI